MKAHNVIIRGFLVASLTIAMTGSLAVAAPKAHPYGRAFETQVSTQLLDKGQPSVPKINAYIARLEQKYREVVGARNGVLEENSVLIGGDRPASAQEQERMARKLEETDVALALRAAINDLEKLKTARGSAEIMSLAYSALDLESSVRFKGSLTPIESVIVEGGALLSPWKIPLRSAPAAEASNLYNPAVRGYLSESDIQGLIGSNGDLSVYEPQSSTFWQAQPSISQVKVEDAAMGKNLNIYRGTKVEVPADNTFILDQVRYADTKPKIDVYTLDSEGKKTKFKIKFGAELHAEPVVAALMMTLGFPSDLSKYSRNIKVILGQKTVAEFTRDWEAYYRRDALIKRYPIEKYILEQGTDPQSGNYLVFKEGLIELRPKTVGRLGGWSMVSNGNDSLRELRGLMMVQTFFANSDVKDFDNNKVLIRPGANGTIERAHVISDLGYTLGGYFEERPNLYSANMVSGRNNREISLTYRSFQRNPLRQKITYADAKWAARLIAGLTRSQLEAGVRLGGFDQCLQKIYVEKMVMRRNDLVRNFGLVNTRQRDGTTIQLLNEPYKADDLKVEKVCDIKSLEENFTSSFQFNAGYILGPLGKAAWGYILDQARTNAGGMKRISLMGSQFDTRLQGVVEVMINPGQREIEQNMNPASADEMYIVKDTFEVGIRAGVSYGAFVDTVVKRVFTLTYPARTLEEGRVNNGFIFNVLLVDDVANRRLPAKFVLKTEHYVENGFGLDLDNKTNPIAPLGLRVGAAKVRVLRTVLDSSDPSKMILFRDTSRFTQDQLGLFTRLAFFKIPLFETIGQHNGHAVGRASTITADQIQRMPTLLKGIKVAAVNGDFSAVQANERNLYVENDFSGRKTSWGIIFFKNTNERRLEYIRLTNESNPEASRTILQNRQSNERRTNFATNQEMRGIKVETFSSSTTRPENFQIKVQVIGMDSNTKEKEMAGNFLDFVNGLSTTGRPLIPFTPSLGYSTNGRFGAILTQSVTNYYQQAIGNILNATDAQVLEAVAASNGINVAQLQQLRSKAREVNANRGPRSTLSTSQILRQLGMSKEQYDLARHTGELLDNLKDAKRATNMEKKVKRLSELFRKAAYVKANGFFDGKLLGALNRLAGESNIYGRHVITNPTFSEVNLVEEEPLRAVVGREHTEEAQYLMYVPQTPTDLYFMFKNWF